MESRPQARKNTENPDTPTATGKSLPRNPAGEAGPQRKKQMAYVFGYPKQKPLKQDLITLGILLAVPAVVISMMFDASGDLATELATAGSVGGALMLLLLFAYARMNPKSLQRVFKPQAYQRSLARDKAVVDNLAALDDTHFVFNDIIFELFGVEHMVVSEGGIRVIGKVASEDGLRVDNNTLFAGDKSLETLTGNTWRVCHLVNIVLKKWFEVYYMPQPVLVTPRKDQSKIRDFDGIAIVSSDELPGLFSNGGQALKPEAATGFAKFVKERYAPHK